MASNEQPGEQRAERRDELFGLDGTQPLPPQPLLPDPLGGLVTGAAFTDPVTILGPTTVPPPPPVTPVSTSYRRTTSASRRATVKAPGARAPSAIPVAEALPSRPVQRPVAPPASRPAVVPLAPGVRAGQLRQPSSFNVAAPTQRQSTTSRRRGGGGAGCAIFVLIVIVVVGLFILLGVLGQGPGAGGFGGG